MVEIRPYQDADWPDVDRITQAAGVSNPPREDRRNYLSIIDGHPSDILVADVDGQVVGSVLATRIGCLLAHLWSLAVDEPHRQQGLATALVTAMEDNLRADDVEQVWGTIETSNAESLGLFDKLGYREIEEPYNVVAKDLYTIRLF